MKEKVEYIICLLKGILGVHKNGYIIRNLSPQNVVIKNKRILITDLSKAVLSTTGFFTHSPIGDIFYVAPE